MLALEVRLTGGEEEQSGTCVGYTGGRGQDGRPVGGPEGDGDCAEIFRPLTLWLGDAISHTI